MWPLTDLRPLLSQERADLAGFLATLTPRQWQAPTLCGDWRSEGRSRAHHPATTTSARAPCSRSSSGAGPRISRINAAALSRYADLGPQQLLELLADNPRPQGVPARRAGGSG